MQAAKKVVESIKETAANIGASAKSGLEKTKATVQEKAEKMGGCDPMLKGMATERKEERINQAEMEKQEAREHNAAAKLSAVTGNSTEEEEEDHYTTTGPVTQTAASYGQPMDADQMSTMPAHDHGLEQSVAGQEELTTEDMMGSYLDIETNFSITGVGGTSPAHNVPVDATAPGSGTNFN